MPVMDGQTDLERELQGVAEIAARHAAATRGPWRWFVGSHDLYLATVHSGHLIVMDFARDGMQRAIVRFRDQAMCVMDKAWRWVHDRSNGPVEHPDAVFIEHAWSDINRLLPIIGALQNELTKATERARIAAAAYDGQQSSQRELEALYQAATERAERAENRQRDMVTALLHTYMRLFPTFEFVSYEQALAVIEREWGGMQAVLDRADDMANALVAYFNKRGADHSMRKGNEDIGDLADALSNYGPLRNAEMDARREQGGML